MRHSRAQHQSHSFPNSDDTIQADSQVTDEVFLNNVKRPRNAVLEQGMNRLQDLEGDTTALAPEHIFRPWRQIVVGRGSKIRELGGGSSIGLRTEVSSEKTPSTGNQDISTSTFSNDSVRFGRRASRLFNESDPDATSRNSYSRI
ncbi:uncharacterized protein ColSpa_06928 [Colletotrichum spaethianum]|uniref:Uncharacterized protein n=1 Tax=Colletotrichum spaethianum TaxID=700344 RepID=A0AA37NYZ0_9PEZI|nr:uncharacterized protein ColSpa_06928 [Colletotrichum spaethianum]GKT46747.1 hypothetical protein ColSpa_06928 [Colletotrichum spaethianum]